MPRRTSPLATQAQALRALADELEAGKRQLSPAMAKALNQELARGDDSEYEELSPEEWESAWADEIDHRLAAYHAGKAGKLDLVVVLEDLRGHVR